MTIARLFALILASFLLCACAGGDSDSTPEDQTGDGDENTINNDGDEDPITGALGEQCSTSGQVTPEDGGELTLTTAKGDRLTLNVPPLAVKESIEITITWLAEAPTSSLKDIVFALRFEPSGLVFNEPVHLEVAHHTPFLASEDITLFHVASESLALAMTVEPITNKTETILTHFSYYAGGKGGENMEMICSESEFHWLDPAERCIDNWPMIDTLLKCATWAESPDSYINMADSLMAQSYTLMRAKPVPQDDYCHRKGSASGKYIDGLWTCATPKGVNGTAGYLNESTIQTIQDGMAAAATELAQAWLDSAPPKGDSCYKLGKVEEWMDYAACLQGNALHTLHEPDAPADLFPNHKIQGMYQVQKEFLDTPRPANHSDLCGWYLECAEMHASDTLVRDLVEGGEWVDEDLETLLAEVRADCLSLWDVSIDLDITHNYLFSGIDEYTADFTVKLHFSDVDIVADDEGMQTAGRTVEELGGVLIGEKDTLDNPLFTPFITRLKNGGQFIQMSFMLTDKEAKSLQIVDNGSTYTCHMPFACEEITDFEVRKHSGTGASAPMAQMMVMRTLANSTLSWAGNTLPKNTGYFVWRMENLVEYCQYDSDKSKWSCEKPTMGTVAEPRPGTDSVVSDPRVPDHHFFNAYLSPQQVKNFIDRNSFSFTHNLTNTLDINDGSVTEKQTQKVTVRFTPKD